MSLRVLAAPRCRTGPPSKLWRHRRRSPGQSLVEFALALPVLLLLLLICIDFGRVFLGWVTLNNAARVAANYAASYSASGQSLTAAQVAQYQTLVANETSGIDCSLPIPVPTPAYDPATPMVGGQAMVTLKCAFQLVTPLLGLAFPGGTLPVSASADFPIRSGVLANIGPGVPPITVPPNQDFTVTPTSGPAPLTVNFSLLAQLGGAAQTYLWTFGDYDPNTGLPYQDITANPPAHTYAAPGTYTVALTETNAAGSSTYTHTVVVTSAAVVAGFYGTVPSPCVTATTTAPLSEGCGGPTGTNINYSWPMTVNFTNTSTPTTGATYSWNFGDGSAASSAATPSHQYTTPGSYTVTLTVTTSTGTNTAVRANYVNGGCVVPSFSGVTSGGNTATNLWKGANFQASNLYFWQTDGTYSTNNPSGNNAYTINQQNPQGGAFFNATPTNGNNYACTTIGRVAPSGANPAP